MDDLTQIPDDELDRRIQSASAQALAAPLPKAESVGNLSDGELDNAIAGKVLPAALAEGTGALPALGRFGVRTAAATAAFPSMGPTAVAETANDPAKMPAALLDAFGKAAVMEAVGEVQGALTPKI